MESGPFRVLRGCVSAIIGGPQFGMPALRSRDVPPRCDRLGLCGLGTAGDLPSAPRHIVSSCFDGMCTRHCRRLRVSAIVGVPFLRQSYIEAYKSLFR